MSNFSLNFPSINDEQCQHTIASGQIVFLVGANGTGKSTRMYKFAKQNSEHVRKITAHGKIWFDSNSVYITPNERLRTEERIINLDMSSNSRWGLCDSEEVKKNMLNLVKDVTNTIGKAD